MSSLPPLHHHPFYTFLAQAQRFNQMSMFSPISSIKGSYHPASIPSSIDPTKMMTPKVNSESARPLIEWFDAHLSFPYPSYEDMKHLKQMTGFSDTQLGDWFRNRRRNYKKKNGNIPWKIPPMSARKRRASSTGHDTTDDSNTSSDSLSTSHSSPESRTEVNQKCDAAQPKKRPKLWSVVDMIR